MVVDQQCKEWEASCLDNVWHCVWHVVGGFIDLDLKIWSASCIQKEFPGCALQIRIKCAKANTLEFFSGWWLGSKWALQPFAGGRAGNLGEFVICTIWMMKLFRLLFFLFCVLHWVVCCTQQMGNVGVQHNVNFIISTGDNFYENGLTGPDDEQFSTSFSNIYTQKSLQTTWYSGTIVFPVGRCQRLGIYVLWLFWIYAIDCRMSGHYFMLKWQTLLAEFVLKLNRCFVSLRAECLTLLWVTQVHSSVMLPFKVFLWRFQRIVQKSHDKP